MPATQKKKIGISLLIPFALLALVFGSLVWKKMRDSRELKPVPGVNEPASVRKAVLFFVAGGNRLMREARELESCSDETECVKDLLDELFSGPVGDLDLAIPENAAVNNVRLEGDLATIGLNSSFADDLPSGSSSELLAVYSIVNTVCINYPGIARVRLTLDGDRKPVLKHLDLSDPLLPDYTLEQAVSPPEETGTTRSSTPAVKKGTQ